MTRPGDDINPGDRFGHLVVRKRVQIEGDTRRMWLCDCDCGRERTASTHVLTAGLNPRCARWDHEILGKRFGKLIVEDFDRYVKGSSLYRCKCDCGETRIVQRAHLMSGDTNSCGCAREGKFPDNFVEYQKESIVDGTHLGNLTNAIRSDNKSGIKGVGWDKRVQRWHARIRLRGKSYSLGYFDDIVDAAEARREAEQVLFDPILEAHGLPETSEEEYQKRLAEVKAKHKEAEKKRRAERKMGIKGDE